MGAILAEMDAARVKELFRWGTGDWWTQALTQPGAWNSAVLRILNEAHHEVASSRIVVDQFGGVCR